MSLISKISTEGTTQRSKSGLEIRSFAHSFICSFAHSLISSLLIHPFAHLLIHSLLIMLKITHFCKKATMSHSLTLLFQKSDVCDLSKLLSKNELFAQKFVFLYTIFLTVFFLSLPKSESLPLLFAHLLVFKERLSNSLIHTFLKSNLRDSLLSLFTKEQPYRFVQVAHDKRATGAIHTFSVTNCSVGLSLTKNE